jgi:nucleotide-binding universal stress UspA family protein
MIPAPTLLVPLDGSLGALAALPVARGLAEVIGATVTLVHVGSELVPTSELLDRIGLSLEDVCGCIIEQDVGSPAEAIVQIAVKRRATLIVMSAPSRSDEMYPFGSVPGDVLQTAPCPVVLVPPERGQLPWTLRQLALPHDGTPISAAAIAPAAELASRAGAELVVIHVATTGAGRPAEPGTFAMPRYLDQPHHEWPAWTTEFLERVRSAGHLTKTEKIRLVLTQGEVSVAILEFARRNATDLIALAWRGAVEPEHAHTVKRVIRDAECPVIVFRVQS